MDQWSSLLPGTFLHSLQGYVLALGFYILYRRHSLANALCYVFLGLSIVYTWTFPTFVLVDFQPPAKWFFVVWWAHFWMAIAAWFMAQYAATAWRRLRQRLGLVTAGILVVAIWGFPVAFVFWRVATWQFAVQREIDQRVFDQVDLVLHEGPRLDDASGEADGDARYAFTLRFGPRPYIDYINATKAIDAGPIVVTGKLLHHGITIAYCGAYVPMLETPNTILVPADYFPALERMRHTDIRVECTGSGDAAEAVTTAGTEDEIEVMWSADVILIGDRESIERTYGNAEEGPTGS